MNRISLDTSRQEFAGSLTLGRTRGWVRPTLGVSALFLTLLVVACGSSDEPVPTATAVPPTATQPVPTTVVAPKPLQATFADGQFTVNFLYRSDLALTAAIETVDVDSILESTFRRIGSLLPDEKFTINFVNTEPFQFRNPSTSGLSPEQQDALTQRGFIIGPISSDRIEAQLNPNGSTEMAVVWRDVVPSAIAESIYLVLRQELSVGVNADSLLDFMVGDGLGIAFQEEAFPGLEERLRRLLPDFAEVVFDLTAEQERDVWAAAQPDLDGLSRPAFDRIRGGKGEFPFGAGGAVGYRIVQAYRQNNPGATPSSLLLVSTVEIFEGSNYNP